MHIYIHACILNYKIPLYLQQLHENCLSKKKETVTQAESPVVSVTTNESILKRATIAYNCSAIVLLLITTMYTISIIIIDC